MFLLHTVLPLSSEILESPYIAKPFRIQLVYAWLNGPVFFLCALWSMVFRFENPFGAVLKKPVFDLLPTPKCRFLSFMVALWVKTNWGSKCVCGAHCVAMGSLERVYVRKAPSSYPPFDLSVGSSPQFSTSWSSCFATHRQQPFFTFKLYVTTRRENHQMDPICNLYFLVNRIENLESTF